MQAPEQSNEEEAIETERKRLEKLHEEPVRRYVLLFTFFFVDWYAGWLLLGSNLFDNTQQYSSVTYLCLRQIGRTHSLQCSILLYPSASAFQSL